MSEVMPPTEGGHTGLSQEELEDAWVLLSPEDRLQGFLMLDKTSAEDLVLGLSALDMYSLLKSMPSQQRRGWLRFLAPDDAADVLQEAEPEERGAWAALLDETARKEVQALLAYAEDDAGGLMSPRFARVRPDMHVEQAIKYLRLQARERVETIYYVYVLDAQQKLLGIVSFRELFAAATDKLVQDVMERDVITVPENMDQESVGLLFKQHALLAVPVVDALGVMKGIVTVDDIVEVVDEEATEDIQKMGGMEALEQPYLQAGFATMIRKRAGWLSALFIGELLTTTAMAHYELEISRAVILTLFIPLIISSGGNSGSQATTLVIRAMALDEVRLRDWWHVARRELAVGLCLGGILGSLGLVRVLAGAHLGGGARDYQGHSLAVALTVAISLVGVVLFGTLAGSLLPFLLRRLGLDPASASAPFVATLVDVSGLVIYFTAASALLSGSLL